MNKSKHIEINSENIQLNLDPEFKSMISFGGACIFFTIKKFNWVQKKMLKLFFGIEAIDCK